MAVFNTLNVVEQSIFPLSVSSNGRFVEDALGNPFQFTGECAWAIAGTLDTTDIITYLDDREAKGVNLIEFRVPEPRYSDQSPVWRNHNGDLPFTGTISGFLDFSSTPVEAYWAHVDFILEAMNDRGMTALLFPAYIGFTSFPPHDGFGQAINNNGTTRMATYGTFLGERYADQPNIIWCIGGDCDPVEYSDITAEMNALANAIKAAAPDHLMTAYANRGNTAFNFYDESWLDLNSVAAATHLTASVTETGWDQTTKPIFLLEQYFGNEDNLLTDEQVMAGMWFAILSGNIGHIAGQDPLWHFSEGTSPFCDDCGLEWSTHLDDFGSQYLEHVRAVQLVRDFSTMVPNHVTTRVTSSHQAMHSTQALVAFSEESGGNITVNKAQFVSATFRVRWFNPRTGALTVASDATFGSGSQTFTKPSNLEWVLLADDNALGLDLP